MLNIVNNFFADYDVNDYTVAHYVHRCFLWYLRPPLLLLSMLSLFSITFVKFSMVLLINRFKNFNCLSLQCIITATTVTTTTSITVQGIFY